MTNRAARSITRSVRRVALSALAAAAVVSAFAVAPVQAEPQAVGVNAEQDESTLFIRFRDLRNGGVLETSIVTYVNDAGQEVDLIGAVHVGDEAYYDLLDERFAGYDVLLYEMVKPKNVDMAARNRATEEPPFAMKLIGGLQKGMQLALELDFQTEEINYSAANFVHADLDLETFMQLQEERGESFLDLMIKQMVNDIMRPAEANGRAQPQVSLLEIMDAMNAPDRARRLKLLFARELSRMDDLSAVFNSGEEGSVILDVRNEKAVEVLDSELARAGIDEIGIFYGAAHMKGIAELLEERGFRRQGQPEYLVAWDMTLDNRGRREMQELTRQAIIENAGGAAEGGAAAAAMKAELDGLRRENEALRRQVQALRQQLEAADKE